MISNCGHDEHGKTSGGTAGDQSGTEYYIRSWYNGNWNHCFRHPNATVRAMIATIATAAANNNKIGYDQSQRTTYWTQLNKAGFDPSWISVACEADCSSSTMANVAAAGHRTGVSKLQAVNTSATTSTMRASLIAAGFQDLTASKYLVSDAYLYAGDILLREPGHVCINVTTGPKATETQGTPSTSPSGATGKAAVKEVQRWLNLNYNSGLDVDGIYGPKTRKALVKAYQRALNAAYKAGLAVDGVWGPKTKAATRVLKVGSTGNLVKILQGALICLGYDTGGFDGIFGSMTASAVKSFQRSKGLSVDGQAGKNTFASLFG